LFSLSKTSPRQKSEEDDFRRLEMPPRKRELPAARRVTRTQGGVTSISIAEAATTPMKRAIGSTGVPDGGSEFADE
jgi:hypothetical protein